MGTGMTVAGVGLGLVAVGALVVAAIKFLPGLLEGISDFKFPELPKFPEFPEFPKFPELPNFFGGDPLDAIRGPGDIEIPFTPIQDLAFAFKKLIGRPQILGAEIFADAGGTSIVQVDPRAPLVLGRKKFGSDFVSAERLADLFDRFKLTGRLEPGGRQRRITTLIEEQDAALLKRAGIPVIDIISNTRKVRGPNSIGNFGAKGVISGAGFILQRGGGRPTSILKTRVVKGFTARASAKTKAFFASGQAGARSARGRI